MSYGEPKIVSCPICHELSGTWINSEQYWCYTCEEMFPIHINSPEWWDWFRRKFQRVV